MGATELQIFVSLVVVLGAAFVALICDFLKGSNERLREANLELQVRQDQRFVQPAEQVARESMAERALARKVYAAHQPVAAVSPLVTASPETLEHLPPGGRRRPRRERAPEPAAPILAPAAEQAQSVSFKPAAEVEPLVREKVSPAMAQSAPVVEFTPVAKPAAFAVELTDPPAAGAAPVTIPAAAPESRQTEPPDEVEFAEAAPAPPQTPAGPAAFESEAIPSEAEILPLAAAPPAGISPPVRMHPISTVPVAESLAAQRPAVASELSFPEPAAVEAGVLPLSPAMPASVGSRARMDSGLAMPFAGASEPQFAATWFATPVGAHTLAECDLVGLAPCLPMAGAFVIKALPVAAVAVEAGAPVFPRWMGSRELAPVAQGRLAVSTQSPVRSALAGIVAIPDPSIQPSGLVIPASQIGLESALTQPAEHESLEAAAAQEQEIEEPIVRIRVLHEEPAPVAEAEAPAATQEIVAVPELVEQTPAGLEEIFASIREPDSAGPVEEPQRAVAALEDSPKLIEPAPAAPAWRVDPVVPRDNVVELPVAITPAFREDAHPQLQLPAGWQEADVLRSLLASPQPFTGFVACIAIADLDRQLADYGEERCEEAVKSLCTTLGTLAGSSNLLCRFSNDEILLLLPNLSAGEQAGRTRLLAELLWDFQLRALSSVPLMCHWGAAEASREPLAPVIERAREQMSESRRMRQGGSSILGRFRRRVVNA